MTGNLRLAKLEDLPKLASYDKEVNLTPWSLDNYNSSFKNRSHKIYVLGAGKNEIIGAMVVEYKLDEVEILQVWIKAGYQNHGYGEMLLTKVIQQLKHLLPIEQIFLEVRQDNEPAIHLYEKVGFVKVGSRPGYYKVDNWQIDANIMVLKI